MPKGKGYGDKRKVSMTKERTTGHPKSKVGKRAAAQNAKSMGKAPPKRKK